MEITLAYSPCPNDTFIFYALAHHKIDTHPFTFNVVHHDIATLNKSAQNASIDVVKISCAAYGTIREDYNLLSSGAALGKGYGPLILTHKENTSDRKYWRNIALPGPHTTASLLTKRWFPDYPTPVFLPFNEIIDRLSSRQIDAGVVIHESRFTYEDYGLKLHTDLGQWWWITEGLPLPLGVICVKKEIATQHCQRLTELIRESLSYARDNRNEVMDYIRSHSQESDESVLNRHIELYVNEYTWDLGKVGQQAIQHLLQE